MEYLHDRRLQADVPVADIITTFECADPSFVGGAAESPATQFREEAEETPAE